MLGHLRDSLDVKAEWIEALSGELPIQAASDPGPRINGNV